MRVFGHFCLYQRVLRPVAASYRKRAVEFSNLGSIKPFWFMVLASEVVFQDHTVMVENSGPHTSISWGTISSERGLIARSIWLSISAASPHG